MSNVYCDTQKKTLHFPTALQSILASFSSSFWCYCHNSLLANSSSEVASSCLTERWRPKSSRGVNISLLDTKENVAYHRFINRQNAFFFFLNAQYCIGLELSCPQDKAFFQSGQQNKVEVSLSSISIIILNSDWPGTSDSSTSYNAV